jgi:hypothetical protein
MGTLADQLAAEAAKEAAAKAPPGSGRLKASLGIAKPDAAPPKGGRSLSDLIAPGYDAQSKQDDYDQAKATALASLAKTKALTDKINAGIQTVADPVRKALGPLEFLAPDRDVPGQVMAVGAGGIPFLGETTGQIARVGNMISNVGRKQRGDPEVDSDAVYRAYRDVQKANQEQIRGAHPVTAAVGTAGGMERLGAGLGIAGGFLGGLEPVAAGLKTLSKLEPIAKTAKTARALKLASQLKFNPDVVDWAENTGKGALSAATSMGLWGTQQGEGLGERAESGLRDFGWGGLLGGTVAGVGVPLLDLAAKGGKDVLGYFGSKLKVKPPEGLITPAEEAAAKETVAALARRNNVTAANVGEKTAGYSDPVLGQVLGTEGQNLTSAVARRQGNTGNVMRALQRQRAGTRPTEIKAAIKEHLGYSPDEVHDLVGGIVQQGRETVAPMYAAAEESPFGVTRPDLERLLGSRTGKALLGHVSERAKLQELNPEGLTYAPVESPPPPGGPIAAAPDEAPPVGQRIIQAGDQAPVLPAPEPVPIPRAPAEQPGQGPEFLRWLSHQGGPADEAGEMAALDLSKLGQRSKNSGKYQIDVLRERARDEGFWPTEGNPPTRQQFLDQVKASRAGNFRYGRAPDPVAQANWEKAEAARAQNRHLESTHANAQLDAEQQFEAQRAQDIADHEAWQKQMEEIGNQEDWRSTEPEHGAAPAEGYAEQNPPRYELAQTTGLTPRSLIHLHQLSRPSYTNGKLDTDRFNLEQADFHRTLGRILTGHPETGEGALLPDYKAPKDIASGYLGTSDTYNNFSGKLTAGKLKDFTDMVTSLKNKDGSWIPEKWQGAKLAAIQDMQEMWSKGMLHSGGKFAAPGIEVRLRMLFGEKGSKALIQQMERTSEQAAAESRMAPFSGSRTAEINAGMGEVEAHAGEDLAKAAKLAGKGPSGILGELIANSGAYTKTAGSTVGYRDALGKLLALSGPEQEALLRELERMPAPRPKISAAREVGVGAAAPFASH